MIPEFPEHEPDSDPHGHPARAGAIVVIAFLAAVVLLVLWLIL